MPISVPPPVSPLASPGSVIAGKYRLDSLVGYGGMGSVWAATHLGLGHQIAIKLIAQAHIRSQDVRRRFDTEAKAVARLKSRHVVQVYDNGELEDGTPYIAMELLQGESLHRRIHHGGPMQLPEAVAVIGQVCRALTKAHAAGITHRDIKPDNIFLANSEDDGGYIAKVLDFGVAKLALNEGEQSSTQTGSLVGTPLYMSPEQARGLKNIDHRTDLYSLALVAYTMLSGNLAFSGESFGDLLLKICTQSLPSLRQGAPWLPPTVDDWFQRAAAREPQDRFQSAQEMADALAAAAGGSAVVRAPTASIPDQTGNIRIQPTPPQNVLGDSITKQYARAQSVAGPSTMTGATMQAGGPPLMSLAPRGGRGAVVALSAVVGVLLAGIGAFVLFGHHDAPPSAGAGANITTVETPVPPAPPAPEPPKPAATATATAAAIETATPPAPSATGTVPKPASKSSHVAPQPPQQKPKPPANANEPAKPNSDTVDLGY